MSNQFQSRTMDAIASVAPAAVEKKEDENLRDPLEEFRLRRGKQNKGFFEANERKLKQQRMLLNEEFLTTKVDFSFTLAVLGADVARDRAGEQRHLKLDAVRKETESMIDEPYYLISLTFRLWMARWR